MKSRDPNIVMQFASKAKNFLFGKGGGEEEAQKGTNAFSGSPIKGYSTYPLDILTENSEITKAIQFNAYEYKWKATVGDKNVSPDEKHHKWSCYLPLPQLADNESHGVSGVSGWGMSETIDKMPGAMQAAREAWNAKDAEGRVAGALGAAGKLGEALAPVIGKGIFNIMKSTFGNEWNVLRRNLSNGDTVNPLNSIIYEGTDLRNFQFSFNLVARNKAESFMIDRIVKNFKSLSRASAVGVTQPAAMEGFIAELHPEYLSHPHIWEIKFFGQGTDGTEISTYLPKIKTCILTSIGVTYAGSENGNPIFFRESGAPVEYTISLTFNEMYMNLAEDI